jgi:hypothetical protein
MLRLAGRHDDALPWATAGGAYRLGRLWIRRASTATYDVMFRPTGNGEFRIATEDGLRALLGSDHPGGPD